MVLDSRRLAEAGTEGGTEEEYPRCVTLLEDKEPISLCKLNGNHSTEPRDNRTQDNCLQEAEGARGVELENVWSVQLSRRILRRRTSERVGSTRTQER